MNIFIKTLKALEGIDYVIVGGFAAVMHGNNRFTSDLDIVCLLEENNIKSLMSAIVANGYSARLPVDPNDFADSTIREKWIKEKNLMVFSFVDNSNPLFALDIFAEYPIPYTELKSNSIKKQINGFTINICSIEHLIKMKEQSNRPQDLTDISALKELMKIRS